MPKPSNSITWVWPEDEFERNHIKTHQDARYEADAWEDPTGGYVDDKSSVYIMDIAKGALSMETNRLGTADQRRITAILTRLEWYQGKEQEEEFLMLESLNEQIKKAMEECQEISSNGMRSSRRILGYDEQFDKWRAEMLTKGCAAQFERACQYLNNRKKTKNINPRSGSSYLLKHQAEAFMKERFPSENYYISNGMFIAAAIYAGFSIKRTSPGSPNVFFNIAKAMPDGMKQCSNVYHFDGARAAIC